MDSVIFSYPGQLCKSKWTEGANETAVVRIRENILIDTSFLLSWEQLLYMPFPAVLDNFLKYSYTLQG